MERYRIIGNGEFIGFALGHSAQEAISNFIAREYGFGFQGWIMKAELA